jgi:recombination associated protein RdgC
VHAANGYVLLCLNVEEKLLPATVVKQEVDARLRALESADQRLSRQARLELKDNVTLSLLPKAFSKYTRIYAYLDQKLNLMVLNTANKRHTELFLDAMQKSLPLVKLHRPESKRLPEIMTQWLTLDNLPSEFEIAKSCMLQDSQYQARVIRCKEQELSAEPIMKLLKDGCEVKQLALQWHEHLQFTLAEDCIFRSLRFAEQLLESASAEAEDRLQQFDADFALMTATLHEFFQVILPLVLKSTESITVA